MKLKIEKRLESPYWLKIIIPIVSIIGALLFCAIILIINKTNPIQAYKEIFSAAFGTKYGFSETLVKCIPLILASLGIALALNMLIWNIGAEGQLFIGAWFTTFIALYTNFPSLLKIPIMIISGFLGGALWGVIPGILKAYLKVNEVITTLLMNYIAIFWVDYFVYGSWKDPKGYGFPYTSHFSPDEMLPEIGFGRLNIGIFLGIIIAIILYLIIYKTKWGYEIRVIGENQNVAKYSGINIEKNILIVMLISGGLAGLAGMSIVSGIEGKLHHHISTGYGYTAIIIAWLARKNPLLVILVSILISGLFTGGEMIQISLGLSAAISRILQGAILLFVLAGDFFLEYKIKITHT